MQPPPSERNRITANEVGKDLLFILSKRRDQREERRAAVVTTPQFSPYAIWKGETRIITDSHRTAEFLDCLLPRIIVADLGTRSENTLPTGAVVARYCKRKPTFSFAICCPVKPAAVCQYAVKQRFLIRSLHGLLGSPPSRAIVMRPAACLQVLTHELFAAAICATEPATPANRW
ncbi:hypothetical protein TNIN_365141 [Trichonephila inaurata madagascariensis]|uniref:Uncharacterized protein n=1 Tax=Trichonephila inaurata madagascariensis TaxID=2747483 RepID=A0A8X6Y346_9ARAC|nr:hypothetical protein TNIN_365141 [Trichonephila inaurata madagascariensis]